MNFRPFLRSTLLILTTILPSIPFLSCSIDPDPGERYAIVYGVANYKEPITTLFFSVNDAVAVENLLKSRGYPSEHVILRTDSEATKDHLQKDIEDIAAKAKADSLFLFYFSGHGTQRISIDQSTHEYIVLYDHANPSNGIVEDSELMRLLQKVPSKRKVVLLDSCNSGGFIRDFPGVDAIPPDYRGSGIDYLKAAQKAFVKYFANVEEGDIPYTEAVVIAAGGALEPVFEKDEINGVPIAHGLFTYYLLQAPYSADRNHDGWITTLEAYHYIRDQIEKNWNRYLSSDEVFLPRISGGPLDLVIF